MINSKDFEKMRIGSVIAFDGLKRFYMVTDIKRDVKNTFISGMHDEYIIHEVTKVKNGLPSFGVRCDKLTDYHLELQWQRYLDYNLLSK